MGKQNINGTVFDTERIEVRKSTAVLPTLAYVVAFDGLSMFVDRAQLERLYHDIGDLLDPATESVTEQFAAKVNAAAAGYAPVEQGGNPPLW